VAKEIIKSNYKIKNL